MKSLLMDAGPRDRLLAQAITKTYIEIRAYRLISIAVSGHASQQLARSRSLVFVSRFTRDGAAHCRRMMKYHNVEVDLQPWQK